MGYYYYYSTLLICTVLYIPVVEAGTLSHHTVIMLSSPTHSRYSGIRLRFCMGIVPQQQVLIEIKWYIILHCNTTKKKKKENI